jgi:hypothetical protein
MLTAEGFWPVAPVGGRSEEERLFAFSLSLVPVEKGPAQYHFLAQSTHRRTMPYGVETRPVSPVADAG